MNRGVLESSPVQQMMAGNPNWWSINSTRTSPQQSSALLPSFSSSSSTSSATSSFVQYPQQPSSAPLGSWLENQDLPESWSQLLMGGFVGEEDKCNFSNFHAKKMENWEDQVLFSSSASGHMVDVKQESSERSHGFGAPWAQPLPTSSPTSCVTSFSSNMLDFSNSKLQGRQQEPDHSSECNSTATGAPTKKAKVQSSSVQFPLKVRKEKLGDRITALHQLVSPFGKTDTASVLLEAIGYIRFLQSQIQALSTPYLGGGSSAMRPPVQGERNCTFPEDPGQLLNDPCMKGSGAPEKGVQDGPKNDLRSRGLCLVPVSFTLQVESDNGADYWAPNLNGRF